VKVVVGLGNPDPGYSATRHNIGFRVVEAFAAAHRISLRKLSSQARGGRGRSGTGELWIVEPLTWMNRSGAAVRWVLQDTGTDAGALIVVYDDLDLPLGRLRFKQRGGHGGHNGIRSIIDVIGTHEFVRLKIGVGRPPTGTDPVEYVLESFTSSETSLVDAVIAVACEALNVALAEGVTAAMNRFHAA